MRLAVDVTTCTPGRAGIGYYTEHLVDALLATRRPQDDLVLISNQPPDPVLAARWAPFLHVGGSRIRAVWMQLDAPRMLSETYADVAAFPNYIAPLASPCPYIVFVHDLALLRTPEHFTVRKRAVMRPLIGQATAGASVVATVSRASESDIIGLLGVPPQRVAVLPGAAHPSCRPAAAVDIELIRQRYSLLRPYVLTVGTLEPRKNLPTLLAAFDRIAGHKNGHRPVDLVVVGGRGWRDGNLRRELDRRTKGGRVHWLGYVPEKDLVALYGGAEVFVYPSRFEGFGLPVLEAMACGAPVVASDVDAIREVAADAAELVDPADDEALGSAIAALLGDPAARAQLRQRGLARAAEFTWQAPAEKLWELARHAGPVRVAGRAVEAGAHPEPAALTAGAPPAGLDAKDWAILATVAYADLFNFAPTTTEVAKGCIGATLDADEVRTRVLGRALVRHLRLDSQGHVALVGREGLAQNRRESALRTIDTVARHRRVLELIATLPFVRMLAFSGGTAHKNSLGKDDIDLFVVAARGHVFTAYSLLFAVTKLTGTRGVVCPNYLVDEDNLAIAYHRDLFTAHQLISAEPISGLPTFDAFGAANAWVRRFFPGYEPRGAAAHLGQPWIQRALELGLRMFAPGLERPLRAAWRGYLGRRAARADRADVVLGQGVIKLHFSDYRRTVLERFANRLGELRAEVTGPRLAERAERHTAAILTDGISTGGQNPRG